MTTNKRKWYQKVLRKHLNLASKPILNCQHIPMNPMLVRKEHKFPYETFPPNAHKFHYGDVARMLIDDPFFANPLVIGHAAMGAAVHKQIANLVKPDKGLPEALPKQKEQKKKIPTITIVYLEKEEQATADIYHRKLAHFSGLKHDEIRNGIECVYMPVDADRGLKLYKYRDDALNALESQAVASKYQIGPDVLSALMEFLFPIGSERDAPVIKGFFQQGIAYGYYTVKVDTQKAKEIYRENQDRFDNLIDELKNRIAGANLNFPIHDLHNNNIGYIGDMLVAIDFGWHTTSKMTGTEQERRLDERQ